MGFPQRGSHASDLHIYLSWLFGTITSDSIKKQKYEMGNGQACQVTVEAAVCSSGRFWQSRRLFERFLFHHSFVILTLVEKNNSKMKEKENENSCLERGIILAATWKFTFQFKRWLAQKVDKMCELPPDTILLSRGQQVVIEWISLFLSDPGPFIVYPRWWLTHWQTCWNLKDFTLAG